MQLSDLIEKYGLKEISKTTKISEENIERLVRKDFAALKRAKALGFLSILGREYGLDLQNLKEEAEKYYVQHEEETKYVHQKPMLEEERSKSILIPLIILGLLAYATWYFLTQFDRKHLSQYLPFAEHTAKMPKVDSDAEVAKSLKIENAVTQPKTHSVASSSKQSAEQMQPEDTQVEVMESDIGTVQTPSKDTTVKPEVIKSQNITIIPEQRLWFGLIDMDSRARKHYTIAEPFAIDVGKKRWLVATSSAPFSLKTATQTIGFNDAREHYLQLDKNGVKRLSKKEYIALGGYSQW